MTQYFAFITLKSIQICQTRMSTFEIKVINKIVVFKNLRCQFIILLVHIKNIIYISSKQF